MVSAALFASLLQPSQMPISVHGHLVHPRRLIVRANEEVFKGSEIRVLRRLPQIGRLVVEVPTGQVDTYKRVLEETKGVDEVDYDFAYRLAYTPNDPLWTDLWHMRDIKADLAWDLSLGSSSIIVAVIDTGVRTSHEDLAANMWVNPGEIAGNGLDDDNDGLVDNVNGYDFAYEDGVPNDTLGHGTPCSGLVAAVGNNGVGMTGVAPRAKIMALKTCVDEGYLYDSNNIPAYLFAADNGAKVFSMSYFTDYDVSSAAGAAFDYVLSQGVLPVAAAGNDSQAWTYYPAGYEGVLAVAATSGGTNKAGFSNHGTWVDVAAPGTGLTATSSNGGYRGFGGTSGACPHVAGLAALIWGANPSLTRDQVRAFIEDTATPVNQAPFGQYANYGVVNAEAAMQAALAGSSTGKSAVVRYVNPAVAPVSRNSSEVRIYGRGFQAPRSLDVRLNGLQLKVVRRSRDFVDVLLPGTRAPGGDSLTVTVEGTLVRSLPLPPDQRRLYVGTEVSTQGATATGSFHELLKKDGTFATANKREDGSIYFQTQFRRVVTPTHKNALTLTRRYSQAGLTEEVFLYDWTTNALPYGNWVKVSTRPGPTTLETLEVKVGNLSRFRDPEGSIYCYIYATGGPSNATLSVDQIAFATE